MSKDDLLNFLERYDYDYLNGKQIVSIKLNLKHKVYVDFSTDKKVKITDKLIGWNFLTGVVEMNLKNALRYNFFGGIIAAFIFMWFRYLEMDFILLILLLIFFFWTLLFSTYYLIQLESFKTRIMNLSKQKR